MRRALLLIAFWSSLYNLAGQSSGDPMSARHALIDSIYNLEDYPQVIRQVEIQVEQALQTEWQDSLYLYMYPYGRAHWKTKGQEKGLQAAETFHQRLMALDADPQHVLAAYTDLSWLFYDAGDMKSCFRVDSTSLVYAKRHPDIPKELLAKHVTYLGFDNRALGNNLACVDWYKEAVEIFNQIDYDYKGKELDYSAAFNALAACQWHAGLNQQAGINYQKSLDQLEGKNDTRSIAFRSSTLGNMALLYEDLGDYTKSRYFYQENIKSCQLALRESKSPKDKEEMLMNLSKTFSNLAASYYLAGQLDLSKEYLDKAWDYRSKILDEGDPRLEYLNNQRSVLEVAFGNYDKADDLSSRYVNACIQEYGLSGEHTIIGLLELASIKGYKEDYKSADSLFNLILEAPESMRLAPTSQDLGLVYMKHADLRYDQGRYNEAVISVEKAAAIYESIFPASHSQVQHTKLQQAFFLEHAGRRDEAIALLDEIVQVLSDKRKSQALSEVENDQRPEILPLAIAARARLRLSQTERSQNEVGQSLHDLETALDIIDDEHKFMRGETATLYYAGTMSEVYDLAQQLTYEHGNQEHNIDDVNKVLSLGERNKAVLLKSRLLAFESLSYSGVPDSILELERTLEGRLSQGLVGDGMTQDEAQMAFAELLEKLERDYPRYFELRYGQTKIVIKDIQSDLLNQGQTILSYSMHTDGVLLLIIDKSNAKMLKLEIEGLPAMIQSLNKHVLQRNDSAYLKQAFELYTLLFAPAQSFIQGKELIIIPDDELYLLSFEMLPFKKTVETQFVGNLLIDQYTISYLLSATTALQFERLEGKGGEGVLAIAPGFSDEMKAQYTSSVNDSNHVDNEYLRLIKQPFAVSTAQRLGDLLSAQVYTGEQASEARFKKEAEKYGIIHLGTHTEVNDVSPLFSKLFLSKSDTSAEDGYLHAYEIYNMELNAELAVLTACETGSGKNDKAEGLRSLAHGFAYAGCPSLIMSLWNIDEKTTAEIINGFYAYLAEGKAKNTALRQAKLDFIQENPELSAPYYWAGLVLMGDEGPINVDTGVDWRYLLGSFLLILLLFLVYKRLS